MKKPTIICLTPVRNEAWILRAFLSATSLWADYIIIADQNSTDGSREIALSYPKVKLIENNREDIHMAEVRSMLMEEARKISGDKIVVALDADEFWAGDFINSSTWKSIMHSAPDDVFLFKWMNLQPNLTEYHLEPQDAYFNWVTHVSRSFFEGEYPIDRFIHEWRLRWSPKSTEDKCFNVDDLRVLHFCEANTKRLKNKWRFYAISSLAIPNNTYNMVSLFRQYNVSMEKIQSHPIPDDALTWYNQKGIDILQMIDFNDEGQYYIDRTLHYIQRDGTKKYAMLDIWDKDFCEKYDLRDPRTIWQKMAHLYLRATKKYAARNIIIRGCDKILRLLCKL